MRVVATILLIGLAAADGFSQKKGERRIAPWSSTLKCLAPLAREARSGEQPLDLEQAFFDGPFRLPDTPDRLPDWALEIEGITDSAHDRLLAEGYLKALVFDDREAERYFRACITLEPQHPEGFLGLAAVNSLDSRRFRCFLEAAFARVDEGSAQSRWAEMLASHPTLAGGESGTWLGAVQDRLRESPGPFHTIVWLRSAAFESLKSNPPADLAGGVLPFPDLPVGHFPLDSVNPIPEAPLAFRMIADRKKEPAQAFQLRHRSIVEEVSRLDRIGNVMPEAGLALGPTLELQLRALSAADPEAALALAQQALEWPRDVHAVGKRWRNLERNETLWVVARRFLAEQLLRSHGTVGLDGVPRGFLPADKAEWFTWKAIAERAGDGNFNPWLAALRREPGSENLVATVEDYLAWKEEEIDVAPDSIAGIPPEWFGVQPSAGQKVDIKGFKLPDLMPRIRRAPAFSLPDGTGEVRTIAEFAGRPVIVIFFLGGGCLHCVEQLTAFGPWVERFEEAGFDILAVGTDGVEYLSETLSQEDLPPDAFPIPIVSDSKLTAFREWGVVDEFDERALHGTFLVSPEGEIIWQETGNVPYMHPDYLLWEATRLLN